MLFGWVNPAEPMVSQVSYKAELRTTHRESWAWSAGLKESFLGEVSLYFCPLSSRPALSHQPHSTPSVPWASSYLHLSPSYSRKKTSSFSIASAIAIIQNKPSSSAHQSQHGQRSLKCWDFKAERALEGPTSPPLLFSLQKLRLSELKRPSQGFLQSLGNLGSNPDLLNHISLLFILYVYRRIFLFGLLINFTLIPETLCFPLYIKIMFKAMQKWLKEMKKRCLHTRKRKILCPT